jgi:hypothetical protein
MCSFLGQVARRRSRKPKIASSNLAGSLIFPSCRINAYGSIALIAQLGERQTEDLKVASSILAQGNCEGT